MFSDLEEERTRFRKNKEDMKMTKKEQKKEKKLIAAKSGLVGIKGILRHITISNIFAVHKPYLNETAFYASF